MDEEAKKRRKKRNDSYLARMQRNPNDRLHGTNSGYRYGCRCEKCAQARREYDAKKKAHNRRKMKAMLEQEARDRLKVLEKSAQPCEIEIYGIGKVAI